MTHRLRTIFLQPRPGRGARNSLDFRSKGVFDNLYFKLIYGFLLFCLWAWKRKRKQVDHEVTNERVPVGTQTQTVIGEEGNQVIGVQRVNTIYALRQNITEVISYKKLSWKYAMVPV